MPGLVLERVRGGGIYNLAAVTASNTGFTAADTHGTQVLINDAGLIACSGFSQGAPVVLLLTNDSDGNGLPDGWEVYYYGHSGVNSSAPLSWNSNLTILQAYQQGLNPLDYYNGQAPTFAAYSGDGQSGAPGEFVPLPLTVTVTANGQPLVNAPIAFSVSLGGGKVQASSVAAPQSTVTVLTDYTGQAKVFFMLSRLAGEQNLVTATPGSGSYAVSELYPEYSNGTAGMNPSPFDPTNVVATMNRDGSADVSWTNNADLTDLEPIDIMYKDRSGQWQVLQNVPAGTTSYHIPAP